jgi:tetrahydromethanopterin S-methyltransferase subunit G
MDIYKIDETKDIEMIVNSFVSEPATEKEWLYFSDAKKRLDFYDTEKQIVTSVVMLANTPIYRNDDGYEYMLVFTAEAIEKMAYDYFSKNGFNKISINHNGSVIEGSAILLESYFVDDNKKAPEKFGTLPKGTWIVSYKVVDKKIWDMIKNKKLRGFSIEVLADLKKLKLKYKNNKNKKNMEKEKNKKQNFEDATTDQGVNVTFDSFEVGQIIYTVAEDGTKVTLEQGTYLINYEGSVYEVVVDENGTMTEINQVSENKAESDFASEFKKLQERLEAIEKKLENFTTHKATAQAKKQTPLTTDGSSQERVHFSNIKVKF